MLNRQVILYISNSYQKVLLSIDTGFFTASLREGKAFFRALPFDCIITPALGMSSRTARSSPLPAYNQDKRSSKNISN